MVLRLRSMIFTACLEVRTRDARGVGQCIDVLGGEVLAKFAEAVGVKADERFVEHGPGGACLLFEKETHQRFQKGHVAIDLNLQEQVGDGGSAGQDLPRALRVDETHQTRLGQWIDGDDLCAVLLRLLKSGEHPGMIRAGVLPHDDDRVGFVDVTQGDGALADTYGLPETDAARFVAHVRAVRQVVRSVGAYEELIEERGFVARAPRCVEQRLVWRVERLELPSDAFEGLRVARLARKNATRGGA